jgi:hypothetical protein
MEEFALIDAVRYTCEYLELLKQEKLAPERMGGRILCMEMFKRIFSSCRVPGSPVDFFEVRKCCQR